MRWKRRRAIETHGMIQTLAIELQASSGPFEDQDSNRPLWIEWFNKRRLAIDAAGLWTCHLWLSFFWNGSFVFIWIACSCSPVFSVVSLSFQIVFLRFWEQSPAVFELIKVGSLLAAPTTTNSIGGFRKFRMVQVWMKKSKQQVIGAVLFWRGVLFTSGPI